jgi:hypothetical protein
LFASVGGAMYGTVKVYKFRMYDIASDKFKVSSRMATYACIKRINARPIKGSEVEIDRREVDGDGMTPIGFEALVTV